MKGAYLLNYLMSQCWAIEPSVLHMMGDIADRKFTSAELLKAFDPVALEGRQARSTMAGFEMREGVALIQVSGVISRYAGLFDSLCGAVSTETLAKQFMAALDDTNVSSIALNVDSPGGDANGIHELSEMIFNARGKKPVVAYVGGSGASAAYWIASAADEVVIDATAGVGSIGVVMSVRKSGEEAETLEIVSSQSPNKRLSAFSEEGKAAYQSQIDQLADVFIERVARNMSVSREKVLSDFAQGGMLIGEVAVQKGMASRLGSLEGVIAELQGKEKTMSGKKEVAASEAGVLPALSAVSTADFVMALSAERPDVMGQLVAAEPETAISAASEISTACVSAGFPELAASLLSGTHTKAAALDYITTASGIKDRLCAAGMGNSLSQLMATIDDPVQLVGVAIHEAKASAGEKNDMSRLLSEDEEEAQAASLNASEIYKKRAR